ncbi:ribonuclease HII [Alkalicoccus luteus]|uniref:Ribonuclease HII n=1 Tax=Alkalicoccus luteus TaxID=1237094 RepID=A0A969PLH3_9BACI|nr:ribonuclease HII [Alkalicoccus luteus]
MGQIATIKEIKQLLQQTDDEKAAAPFREDGRRGVQAELKKFDRKIKQKQNEQDLWQEMSRYECELHDYSYIAGVDEVGRGPLAGGVTAAAVILPEGTYLPGLNDSKKIPKVKREQLFEEISSCAFVGIGSCTPEEIDTYNIYEASKKAMLRAVQELPVQPDYLLVDAMTLPVEINQMNLIKGDARSVSIAAASVVAKVTRDREMCELDRIYPGYGFKANAGYGTSEHLEALERLGPTPSHRRSFSPVRERMHSKS